MSSNWQKIDTRARCYMLITVVMYDFLKSLLLINFWGKSHPEIFCSSYLLKFSIETRQTYMTQKKLEEATQGCENVHLNKRIFYCLYHFVFAHKQVLKFCVFVYVFVFGATSKVHVLCTINCSIQFFRNSMCLIRT